jgi:predicted metal-dependent phosphoesterase TrpH
MMVVKAKHSNRGVDLHTHTLASDGTWSPKSLVEAALARNVGVLSVCDHETTNNLNPVQVLAHKYGLRFIPGVEVAIEHKGAIYHLLLYGFNPENAKLQEMLRESRLKLWFKKQIMAAALRKIGYKLPGGTSPAGEGSTAPIYELACALVNENEALTFKHAWEICREIEPKIRVAQPAVKALAVGKAAGAIATLAHPGRGGAEISVASNETLRELVKSGLEGVEAYYSEHSHSETERLVNFAMEYDLLLSCGSDSHSAHKQLIPWSAELCRDLLECLSENPLARIA